MVGAGTAGSIQLLFGFTGRDWDTDSELQYNRARWFDPKTGRWLSQDPISFAAGDANLYRYVGNEPTNWIDPSGLHEIQAADPTQPYVSYCVTVGNSVRLVTVPNPAYRPPVEPYFSSPKTCEIGPMSKWSHDQRLREYEQEKALHWQQSYMLFVEGMQGAVGAIGAAVAAPRPSQLIPGANNRPSISLTNRFPKAPTPPSKYVAPINEGGFKGRKGFQLKNHPDQPMRSTPDTINGRNFSGHALDQMQNRGIPPSVVQNTILNGVCSPGKGPATQVFTDPINKIRVVVNSTTGNVITVIPGT